MKDILRTCLIKVKSAWLIQKIATYTRGREAREKVCKYPSERTHGVARTNENEVLPNTEHVKYLLEEEVGM
eukprot:284904-Pelagomonas_calceolata.AAC.4